MTRKAKTKSVTEEWLEGPAPASCVRCWICKQPEIAAEVRKFWEAKRDGRTLRSWKTYHREVLQGVLGWKGGDGALLSHVRNHLEGQVNG